MAVQMCILARGDQRFEPSFRFFGYYSYRDLRAQLDFIMLGGGKTTKCASAEPVAMCWPPRREQPGRPRRIADACARAALCRTEGRSVLKPSIRVLPFCH